MVILLHIDTGADDAVKQPQHLFYFVGGVRGDVHTASKMLSPSR